MAKILSARVWILIVFLFLSLLSIDPSPLATGVEVKSIASESQARLEGLTVGEKILTVNGVDIPDLTTFKEETDKLLPREIPISVTTDEEEVEYNITSSLGFYVDQNLSLFAVSENTPLTEGATILEINGEEIEDLEDFNTLNREIVPSKKVVIQTDEGEYAFLNTGDLGIVAQQAKTSNIEKGLELQGGTRVLLKPQSEEEISVEDINNLIDVMNRRLNVYGLSDIKIRSARDLDGEHFVIVEIAGATREEVEELISKQGVFEARIGDDVVFEGGKRDIPYVCKDDGSCAVVESCDQVTPEQAQCVFRFAITLSGEAAVRHAEITDKLDVNISSGGSYLSKSLDLYLDNTLVDSLFISSDLKGQETTQISISGPGYGVSEELAYQDAIENMNNLQTILITGSLPLKLDIVKIDSISPFMGKEFLKNAVTTGILALGVVLLIVFLRYRKIKVVIPMLITSVSEVVILLGFAALAGWNLDLAAIAGIIASVGTGVDHQIIIADEALRKRERSLNWKEKIRRAFFIIMGAYATTVVAMVPLMFAGAGLIKGFALTTIAGVTIGVLITRPAFASMVEKLVG